MRVVDTDNFGKDYPDEKFVTESISLDQATRIAKDENDKRGVYSSRYWKVVFDEYKLQPGFEP